MNCCIGIGDYANLLNIDLRSISTHVCDVVSIPRRVSLMEDNSSHRPEKSYLSPLESPKMLKHTRLEFARGQCL